MPEKKVLKLSDRILRVPTEAEAFGKIYAVILVSPYHYHDFGISKVTFMGIEDHTNRLIAQLRCHTGRSMYSYIRQATDHINGMNTGVLLWCSFGDAKAMHMFVDEHLQKVYEAYYPPFDPLHL